jgi:phosphoglycolate phosphatase-like HAD superfamily hydrolase
VALDRAERATGLRFRPEDVLVVGDSVHDVSCAHAHGIPCLAVGTGRTPESVLQAAGAEWVIGDLREAAQAVPWLG